MEILLVYTRMATYVLVMLISAITYHKHCRSRILIANLILSTTFLFTLFLVRFFDTGHNREIGTALQTTGVILWAVLHIADFLKNGRHEEIK